MGHKHQTTVDVVVLPGENPVTVCQRAYHELLGESQRGLRFTYDGKLSPNGHPMVNVSGTAKQVGRFLAAWHQEDKICAWITQACTPCLPLELVGTPVRKEMV